MQPHGLSPQANVIKECGEEASIPEQLARTARPVGAVSYEEAQERGLKCDVLFCYDLLLPANFVPEPQASPLYWNVPTLVPVQAASTEHVASLTGCLLDQDGEVEAFQRLPIGEVADIIANTDKFKDNCNLVIIDFLIRHGYLKPEQEGYLEMLAGLRSGPCL